MTLQQLQYFCALAESQHYTRTAEKLMISQPSLSFAISGLEKELGTRLFQKQGRNVVLTEAGRMFSLRVNRALDELALGCSELQEHIRSQQNRLTIGYIFSLAQQVQQLISVFLAQPENSGIRIQQKVSHSSGALARDLLTGKVDMVVCIEPPPGTNSVLLEEQQLCFVVAAGHPLAAEKELTLEDILPQPLILVGEGTSLRGTVLRFFEQQNAAPNIAFEAEECNAAAVLAAGGSGYTILPSTRNFAQEGLQVLSVKGQNITRPVYLAWSENGNNAQKAFQSFSQAHFSELP